MADRMKTSASRWIGRAAALVLAGAALTGCVYYPGNGYYNSGYYAAPAYVAPAPTVVVGGGWGWGWGWGGHGGGWGHRWR